MGAQAQLPDDDPRVVAWGKFKQTDEYQNTRRWAARVSDESAVELEGSLWRCFIEGWSQIEDDLKRQLEETRQAQLWHHKQELEAKRQLQKCEREKLDVIDQLHSAGQRIGEERARADELATAAKNYHDMVQTDNWDDGVATKFLNALEAHRQAREKDDGD